MLEAGGVSSGVRGVRTRTTNSSDDAEEPRAIEMRAAKPGVAQAASLHRSPSELIMLSVHADPASTAIGDPESYGAPPRRVVPSERDKAQPTLAGRDPAVHKISDQTFVCLSASETSSCACSAAPMPASRADGVQGRAHHEKQRYVDCSRRNRLPPHLGVLRSAHSAQRDRQVQHVVPPGKARRVPDGQGVASGPGTLF